MSRVNPLRDMEIKEVTRGKRENPLRILREVIDLAIGQAVHPHVGGHRHRRRPLTEQEQKHHAKVDRYLGRGTT